MRYSGVMDSIHSSNTETNLMEVKNKMDDDNVRKNGFLKTKLDTDGFCMNCNEYVDWCAECKEKTYSFQTVYCSIEGFHICEKCYEKRYGRY